jgi:hypothetical protein
MEVKTYTLPLDWDEWRNEWSEWLTANRHRLGETRERFPGKNFLADERLGTWKVNGRLVELSEVTFPNLTERDDEGRLIRETVRGIGITYGIGADAAGAVVHSFHELERELFSA